MRVGARITLWALVGLCVLAATATLYLFTFAPVHYAEHHTKEAELSERIRVSAELADDGSAAVREAISLVPGAGWRVQPLVTQVWPEANTAGETHWLVLHDPALIFGGASGATLTSPDEQLSIELRLTHAPEGLESLQREVLVSGLTALHHTGEGMFEAWVLVGGGAVSLSAEIVSPNAAVKTGGLSETVPSVPSIDEYRPTLSELLESIQPE